MRENLFRVGDGEREGVLFDYDGGDFVVFGDDHVALQMKRNGGYRMRMGEG